MKKGKKTVTILIIVATLVLAGIAIFTAIRLYQLRQQAVAPTAPESRPAAQETQTISCQAATFTLASPTPTPGPTCYSTCSTDSDCPDQYKCQTVGSEQLCVNPSCAEESDCTCGETPTPTPTPTPAASATPSPEIPVTGVNTPTLVGIGGGIVLLIISVLLAF